MVAVYIETTVVSYYTARASRDVVVAGHQQATCGFWQRLDSGFEPFVSALVIKEAGKGDAVQAKRRLDAIAGFPVVETTPAAEELAERLVEARGVPEAYPEDALHIALAAMAGIEFLVTWNFSHINNPFTRTKIREIIEGAGWACPELVSPDELIGDG